MGRNVYFCLIFKLQCCSKVICSKGLYFDHSVPEFRKQVANQKDVEIKL